MTRESFRRDISREFDAMSGQPSPALSARVRSALAEPGPARAGSLRMAGVAAALIALIVVGALVVANFNRHQTSLVPGTRPGASPSALASATPSVTANPSPAQTPPDTTLPAFSCTSSMTITGQQQQSLIDAVRTGTHTGYDRLTIEFKNGQPQSIQLSAQSSATFNSGGGRGGTVTLAGQAGILVNIFSTDAHTSYSGPTDFITGYSVMVEVRQIEDFEGYVQWAIGMSKAACYRAFFLTNPTRLVIDVQNT